jgi:hypothetical protein
MKKIGREIATENNSLGCISKQKLGNYDESYWFFDFTSVVINSGEEPQYVLCLSTLSADCLKLNKLKRPVERKHSEMKKKTEEYFGKKT